MKRVDFKQSVLQAGHGKMEKWVPRCQRRSEAEYIVQQRACSVFKRPHKTLTVLPLLALTPQSTKKYEKRMEQKNPAFFFFHVNPVVTTMPPHLSLLQNNYLRKFSTAELAFFSCVIYSQASHPLALRFRYMPFQSLYPHQNLGQGSVEHSWTARGKHLCVHKYCQGMRLFVIAVWYVHGFLRVYSKNVFRSPHQISFSHCLQISHPLSHRRPR